MDNTDLMIEEPANVLTEPGTEEKQTAYGAPLPPFNPAAAIALLEAFAQEDVEEQRETLAYLEQALNEERAAGGERLVFV
jgi:hypothetical protein